MNPHIDSYINPYIATLTGNRLQIIIISFTPIPQRGQLSVLLRRRRFRDARIDPSRQASADEPNTTKC